MIFRAMNILFWLSVAFTLLMATLPAPPTIPGELGDKLHHLLAFAILTSLAVIAFRTASLTLIALCLAGFGALIELLQMLPIIGRDGEVSDWLADCAAILSVLFMVQLKQLFSGVGSSREST